jgi:DNA-binding NarL/FixJ family response regulator
MITIIIGDDHEIYRDGLQLLLGRLAGVQLVGQATNGQELIDLVDKLRPNVALTDIRMPEKDGIAATRYITAHYPDTGVIALTMYEEDQQVVEMLEAGAMGYLLKNASKEEMEAAIYAVYNQQHYYCSQTTARITRMISKSRFNPYQQKQKPVFKEVELDIIRLICEGLTSKDIATKINLSYRTIEGYRTRILEKMEAHNTAGIIIYSVKNQLVNLKQGE